MKKAVCIFIILINVFIAAPCLFQMGHCDDSDHEHSQPFGDDHCHCSGVNHSLCFKILCPDGFRISLPCPSENHRIVKECPSFSNLFEKSIFHPPRVS